MYKQKKIKNPYVIFPWTTPNNSLWILANTPHFLESDCEKKKIQENNGFIQFVHKLLNDGFEVPILSYHVIF